MRPRARTAVEGTGTSKGAPRARSPLVRAAYVVAGLLCVGLGGLGVIVPGLPTTVFFIAGAACFTRSSERLELWVLTLPGVGQMVQDHRAGLGMPRRSKLVAVASIVTFSLIAVLVLDSWIVRAVVAVAAATGVGVVMWRVPTREKVEQSREP
jgi:uncharacterized membrane protein YbaN (DUF454 family)